MPKTIESTCLGITRRQAESSGLDFDSLKKEEEALEPGARKVLEQEALNFEKAFKKFHFHPRYILYKLKQAILNPAEGWRSFVAGVIFFSYTLTNKRNKQQPFGIKKVPFQEDWYSVVKVPMGRMEKIRKGFVSISK